MQKQEQWGCKVAEWKRHAIVNTTPGSRKNVEKNEDVVLEVRRCDARDLAR